MKTKNFIQRNNYLMPIRLIIFLIKKFFYLQQAKIIYDKTKPFESSIVSEIEKKGFYVIEKFFTEEQCKTMLNAAEQNIQNKEPTYDFPEYGVQRFLNADNIDELKVFFNNKFVEDVAQLYIGRKAKKFQCMYEIKGKRNKESIADSPHFDDWKKKFKVFIYLNDINHDNCPLTIWENSYNQNQERFVKEFEYI